MREAARRSTRYIGKATHVCRAATGVKPARPDVGRIALSVRTNHLSDADRPEDYPAKPELSWRSLDGRPSLVRTTCPTGASHRQLGTLR